ncbi:MAG TPA: L-histidine N(alpha)-methyltransferase [Gemmatimonadaceae bacterium]|jgi:L-histidine N-alpha-methyltransferase
MTASRVCEARAVANDGADRRRRDVLADVQEGLSRTPRELPAKYFYDERGSNLFEQITRLPEYYLTRAEREILVAQATTIVRLAKPDTLIELGAGSAAKTRILLGAMQAAVTNVTYVPVDVSEEFLDQTRAALASENPTLRVLPLVADLTVSFDIPDTGIGARLFAFLGSTIGNFDWLGAVALLRRVRAQMRAGDRFLLGTDLRKDRATLEAAYNDAAGVTAAFNRNMLSALNGELGADFDPDRFAHRAIYDDQQHRIEMYLDSLSDQMVHVPGLAPISLREGESIRTELSHKYDRGAVDALAGAAELRVAEWFTDSQNRFALSLLEPVG